MPALLLSVACLLSAVRSPQADRISLDDDAGALSLDVDTDANAGAMQNPLAWFSKGSEPDPRDADRHVFQMTVKAECIEERAVLLHRLMRERFPKLSAKLTAEAASRLRKSIALAGRLSKDVATVKKQVAASCDARTIDNNIEMCQAAVDTRRKTEEMLKIVERNIAERGIDLELTANECVEKTVIIPEVLKCMAGKFTDATKIWELQTIDLHLKRYGQDLKQGAGKIKEKLGKKLGNPLGAIKGKLGNPLGVIDEKLAQKLAGAFEKAFAGDVTTADFTKAIGTTTEALKGLNQTRFKEVAKACREIELKEFYELMELLRKQISSAQMTLSGGTCSEKPTSQCPEGTEPMSKARFDSVTAAAYGAAAFPTAHVFYAATFLGIVPLLYGADVLFTGGGAGAVASAVGTAYATMFPIYLLDWSSWTTAVVSIWGGSSYDCACYPRQCHYDASKQKCALENSNDKATQLKNKYSALLPFQGWKCRHKVEKGKDVCDEMPCEPSDFEGVQPNDKGYAGKLGIHGKSLYNCLSLTSKKDSRHNSLGSSITLADKTTNDAVNRAKLFDKLKPAV